MAEVRFETRELLQRARAAVRAARDRRRLAEAWQLLQERDSGGAPLGPRAYTDEAIAVLQQLLEAEPDNHDALAHLAIARHARAWQWELDDRPAPGEWAAALELWRRLARAKPFWEELARRLTDPDDPPVPGPGSLAAVRADLMEHLLGIHVEFIRQFVETDQPGRAAAHIELVRGAAISPAAKKRLTDRVYDAMVGSALSEGQARGTAALAALQRFCDLFPEYFPALEAMLRTALSLVAGWSYHDDAQWQAIVDLEAQVRPSAARLVEHAALPAAPLARATLTELAAQFLQRGLDRSRSGLLRCRERLTEAALVDAEQATALGEAWVALALRWAPPDSELQSEAGMIHDRRCVCLEFRIQQVCESEVTAGSARALCRLLRQQATALEAFAAAYPDDAETPRQLAEVRRLLADLERSAALCVDDAWEEDDP